MGFYLRKSISVGPLRFNLSGSGVGVSAGIKGFRVGTGPRGNYIHMGRGGFYYRATLPPAGNGTRAPRQQHSYMPSTQHAPTSATHEPLKEIESLDANHIVDSSSKALLDEINQKRKRPLMWPMVLIGTLMLLAWSVHMDAPQWVNSLIALAGLMGAIYVGVLDQLAKTVVLFYEFDPDVEAAYEQLHSAALQLAGCARVWHIEASGRVLDRKYHAGAASLIRRKVTSIRRAAPQHLKCNIETVAIDVGRQVLHFFPDRVLVYAPEGVGGVEYSHLNIDVDEKNFIEDEGVPRDTRVVGHTWRFVNKNGGPDRRFNNNRQIPICRYTEMSIQSASGINEVIQLSQPGVGGDFVGAVRRLARVTPSSH
ncbi:DUF4236 domain-containing protein [Rhodanobacter sp. DHB23]|uniref:DUF4236 domain-containing protein n=1 Tax=Rhodanobacter sp. DHB23 TaxID=2775923 RepID=UPI00177F9C3D|nr:DUF4236 domain-containing protein [Rhodanobacter sp. DHB23]